jgi:hypothetical protein
MVANAAPGTETIAPGSSAARGCRVVVILPRGEAIRNFVYTGVLERLSRDAEVTLLTVVPGEEYAELLSRHVRAVVPLREVRERWIVRIAREFVDLAHGRWLWSEAAKNRWRHRDLEARTLDAKLKRGLKKAIARACANRTGIEMLVSLEATLSDRFRATEMYRDLLSELGPHLVFNGSHVHSRVSLPAVHAARSLGIPTAAFIFSWDNLTSQGRIIPPYDHYLVWNESLREQLLSIYRGVNRDRVHVTGTPQFDFHFRPEFALTREEFCARTGADPARPIVLYTTGMANHMPGEPVIVERIADLLAGMGHLGPPQLLVRVYPKDRTGRFDDLRRRRADILFPEVRWDDAWLTPRFEDSYDLANALRHAAVGINIASTITLELCMFDTPVINVCYPPPGLDISPADFARYYGFDHYRPVVGSGAVSLARSEEQMAKMVERAIVEPEAQSTQRRALIDSVFGDLLDGRSGERVADALIEVASSVARE